MAPPRRRNKTLLAAAILLTATVALLATATTAAAATPAADTTKKNSAAARKPPRKSKPPPPPPPPCDAPGQTNVPGCSACTKKRAGKTSTCTGCSGAAYVTAPPKDGACACAAGFGRAPYTAPDASAKSSAAHGKSNKGKGKGKGPKPKPVPCTACPAGTVSPAGSDFCAPCEPGFEPADGQSACVEVCVPLQTCAEAGATCGAASDGCGGTLQCGPCSCAPGSYSPNGVLPCTLCAPPSTNSVPASTTCTCPPPRVWEALTNSCVCPTPGDVFDPVQDLCVVDPGVITGCDADKGETPAGAVCVCSAGWFNADTGGPPCTQCGGGSTNTGTANRACTCNPATGEVWSSVSVCGACV